MSENPRRGRLEVRLLGGFGVSADGRAVADSAWARRKPRTLVKLLALQPHARLHREQVMDLLWPGLDFAAAANQLHKAVHGARRALEPGLAPRGASRFVRTEGGLVALDAPGGLVVDATAFET